MKGGEGEGRGEEKSRGSSELWLGLETIVQGSRPTSCKVGNKLSSSLMTSEIEFRHLFNVCCENTRWCACVFVRVCVCVHVCPHIPHHH